MRTAIDDDVDSGVFRWRRKGLSGVSALLPEIAGPVTPWWPAEILRHSIRSVRIYNQHDITHSTESCD